MKFSNGFSCYFSIGQNNGIKIQKDGPSIRIHLFNVSCCFGWFDIENTLTKLLEDAQKSDLLKEQKDVLNMNSELENNIKTLERQCQTYQNNEISLNQKIIEMSKDMDDLSDENMDLMDVEAENYKLKDKIEILENKIKDIETCQNSSSSSESSLPIQEIDYYI